MKCLKKQNGFTLLELVITITILSLIMAIVYGSMRLGTRAWRTGEARAEENQRARVILSQLAEEIRSAHSIYSYGQIGDREKKYLAFKGEPDRIWFITVTPGLTSEPINNKLRAIVYEVDPEQGLLMRETQLFYEDFFAHLETQEPRVLDPEVAGMALRYYYVPETKGTDEGEVSEEGMWLTEWDPNAIEPVAVQEADDFTEQPKIYHQLPRAVEITLTLKPQRESQEPEVLPPLVVPIFWGHKIKLSYETI